MAKMVVNYYTEAPYPLLLNKSFIPKFWHETNEDMIWVECVEDPKLSGYVMYLFLDNWSIE